MSKHASVENDPAWKDVSSTSPVEDVILDLAVKWDSKCDSIRSAARFGLDEIEAGEVHALGLCAEELRAALLAARDEEWMSGCGYCGS